jgi:hypothetical protein
LSERWRQGVKGVEGVKGVKGVKTTLTLDSLTLDSLSLRLPHFNECVVRQGVKGVEGVENTLDTLDSLSPRLPHFIECVVRQGVEGVETPLTPSTPCHFDSLTSSRRRCDALRSENGGSDARRRAPMPRWS